MPFIKGQSGNLKGRPKGVANKNSESVKQSIALLLEDNMQLLESDLKSLKPKDRVHAVINLLKYAVPTFKSVELESVVPNETGLEWIEDLMNVDEQKILNRLK
mgnify:FL=1|tara:strand:- start:360 stop:668 length:309 start_codon:yes stop_codon:yes gene_type:complete